MHTALLIPEVLDAILRQCTIGTLANLARTSRHFFLPCITICWRDVHEPCIPILNSMLELALSGSAVPYDGNDAIWARVDLYCSLIRTLRLRYRPDSPYLAVKHFMRELIPRFMRLRQNDALFPRLQSLTFDIRRVKYSLPEVLLYVSHMVGPALEKCDISIDIRRSHKRRSRKSAEETSQFLSNCRLAIHALLQRLKSRESVLEEFTLFGLPHDDKSQGFTDLIASFLDEVPHLRKFGSDYFTLCPAIVARLAPLRHLEEWSIGKIANRKGWTRQKVDDVSTLVSKIDEWSFPALRKLTFCGEETVGVALLQSLRCELNILSVNLYTRDRFEPDLVWRLANVIQSRGAYQALFDLEFRLLAPYTEETAPSLSYSLFSPLMKCSSLRSYEFAFEDDRRPFELSNAHLKELATAWPHLQTLSFSCERDCFGRLGRTGLTFEGILSLTSRCSQLSSIHIKDINTTNLPPPPPQPNSSVSEILISNDYRVPNVNDVAA